MATLPFDVCINRHGGDRHSREANQHLHPHKGEMRERIRVLVSSADFAGMTVHEIAGHLWDEKKRRFKFAHEISGRITELKSDALPENERLYDSGRTRNHAAVLVGSRHHVRPNGGE